MTLPSVIDVTSFLGAISEDALAGIDPRSDSSSNSLYYRTKDARNAARSTERAQVEIGSPPPEEWRTVAECASEILQNHAKDLEIAAWLVEAMLRLEGFAGLRDGLRVVQGIVQDFWEPCFPELDEDGIEGKVSAVAGLSGSGAVGTLIQPIRLLSLTEGSQASFSLWNYEQAVDLEKITDSQRRQERIDNGATSMEQFMRSVAETPASHFAQTIAEIEEATAALDEMSRAFDAVAGYDAPPTSALKELLEEIARAIRHFAVDKLLAADNFEITAPSAEQGENAPGDGASTGPAIRRVEGYASRDEALSDIIRIAGYFRKTEPQSPISYTLEDAVRRARMSLPELLAELAEDPTHIHRILLAAGIKPPEAPESGY